MSVHRTVPLQTQLLQHRASDPNQSVWVSANAGSGKTHVLAQRVMRLLLRGTPPGKILCLTFTKAAAANMATKVFETLAGWTLLDDAQLQQAITGIGAPAPKPAELVFARRLFARTVETPGGLKIQTIHAFCEKLLHRFPFEANVPARFDVVEELHQAELMERARRLVLAEAALDTGKLGAQLRHLATETSGSEFDKLIREAMQHRALARRTSTDDPGRLLRQALDLPADASMASIEQAMIEDGISPRRWRDMAGFFMQGGKTDQTRGAAFAEAAQAHDAAASDPAMREICLAVYLTIFFTKEGRGPRAARLATAALLKARPDLVEELYKEQERLESLAGLRKAAATFARTQALMGVVDAVLARYDRIKAERGLLDFADLIERTLSLLQRSDAQWVLYKLDSGIDHILIDEAQDTSEAQWKIFEELTGDFAAGATDRSIRRSFFAVGDDKQSIYSFQGAAPQMFHAMRESFAKKFAAGKEPFEHIRLKASFRSVPAILTAVDQIFEPVGHQKGLVPHGDVWPIHEALKSNLAGLIEIWPPQKPGEQEDPSDWRLPLDVLNVRDPASVAAQHVAEKIAELIAEGAGEYVCDNETGRLRPVRPGDILILVRTRGPFFAAVIRALKQIKVPVAGADRLNLTDHIATMDLVAAGRVALLPQDDLALACVLKSPLIGLDDDDLLEIAPLRPASLFEALAASAADRHRRAFAKLDAWRAHAATATPFTFYMRVLGEGGGRRDMEARLGPEACDVIDEFLRLALQHEQEPAPSLSSFLTSLDGVDLPIKRDMETAADAVRVMTVHAAKGLEAKVVFLPDTCGAPSSRHDPKIFALPVAGSDAVAMAWSPRMDMDPASVEAARTAAREAATEEYRRLLYVALTRAEERLYISGFHGVQGRQPGCWAELIEAALAPDFKPVPAFWNPEETILRRLTPGTVAFIGTSTAAADDSLAGGLPAWLSRAAPVEKSPPPPVRPSNALAAADNLDSTGVAAAQREALQRGRLMHVLLQYLPGIAPAQRHRIGLAFLAARAADMAQSERTRLVGEALGVIDNPGLAELFGPGSKAEVAIAGRIERQGGAAIEVVGQVDRIIATGAEVIVADFKTGEAPKSTRIPAAYLTQMALYQAVLAPLWPGRRMRMLLIWTAEPRITWLDGDELGQALAAVVTGSQRG